MELSEIKGERCFEVLADIITPALNIASDEKAMAIFKKKAPKNADPQEYGMKMLKESLPVLMRDHKEDFAAIMAAMDGVTKEEFLENLDFPTFINKLFKLMNDRAFISFLA